MFSKFESKAVHIRDMELGTHIISEVKMVPCKFGSSYILTTSTGLEFWSNSRIEKFIEQGAGVPFQLTIHQQREFQKGGKMIRWTPVDIESSVCRKDDESVLDMSKCDLSISCV